ncbi:MAG: adenylyl-sulfate kinase [Propionibacteriaceae bacterium]
MSITRIEEAPLSSDAPAGGGVTVWLTGLPSAGKSTIATAVAEALATAGTPVEVLDGDVVRPHLSSELGFSREHRDLNVTRIGWVAQLLARHGVVALVPVIAPYASTREAVRADHEASGSTYLEVHVSTPVEVTAERDVKGLYAKAARGELTGLTGVDDPYEEPTDPDLVIDTSVVTLSDATRQVLDLVDQTLGRDLR